MINGNCEISVTSVISRETADFPWWTVDDSFFSGEACLLFVAQTLTDLFWLVSETQKYKYRIKNIFPCSRRSICEDGSEWSYCFVDRRLLQFVNKTSKVGAWRAHSFEKQLEKLKNFHVFTSPHKCKIFSFADFKYINNCNVQAQRRTKRRGEKARNEIWRTSTSQCAMW